ncbi:non-specific lipid transfer protein GPI-anchored 2 [Brachypodium distachyon]|uniref:Bifunctional inhibitor/plant lipid transfer protein/seed storage helical domain-containing protein n=1 Tax=Brachypodium distachyon TaxID=15368 RepID=I1HI91_BRADI|nr:non-specific lipid transfer protein GPI-anchored 2 [Brachypodium distachyon]KQK05680.1 hypothetical protein BRADI_2g21830v3 [Brachypodium distachyon]|eukprot:XP_003566108.1 non-specific lipid transfer protein GPI-anchored 2 [Brachypodium distachyon]
MASSAAQLLLQWAAAAALAGLLLSSFSDAAHHVSVPPSPSPSRSPKSSSSFPPAASPPAVSPAPGPAAALDQACLNSLLNMSDCLPYVQAGAGGAAAKPDKACCPELAGLVDSNPVCLCELLSGAADSYGIAVDYARALALPKVCRVATPPVSTCAALGYNVRLGPSAAPGVSPSAEGPQFPGSSPFASPPAPRSHAAARRFPAAGNLVALAAVVALAVGVI